MDADLHQYRLGQIGSPASTLAALAEINTGSLSKHFGDTQRLPSDALRRIQTTLTDLEMVKTLTTPLPIDWSNVKALREIIAGLKDNTLTITVNKSAPRTRETAYSVKFDRTGRWFAGRRGGEITTSFSFRDCSMSKQVADRLLELLGAAGHQCSEFENGLSVNITKIQQIWPEAVSSRGKENDRS